MKNISLSKFHKGFYKLIKEEENCLIVDSEGEVIGAYLSKAGTTAYLSQKEEIGGEKDEKGGTTVCVSPKQQIQQSSEGMKVWTLEELKSKFPQVDGVVPGETELEHKEKCKKCGREANGFIEEITESDGWSRFEVCVSCAKKTRSKITLY